MADLCLDSNVIAELLAQFFAAERRWPVTFIHQGALSERAARCASNIVRRHAADPIDEPPGLVVANALASIELCRKWEQIVADRFTPYQLAAFLEQPPDWFSVVPLDEYLVESFIHVPAYVPLGGRTVPLEWTDVVHAATAHSRGEDALFATTDQRLRAFWPAGRLA